MLKQTSAHAKIKETYYSNCCCGIRTAIKVSCAKEIKYYLSVFPTEASDIKLYIFRYRFINDTYVEKCFCLKRRII